MIAFLEVELKYQIPDEKTAREVLNRRTLGRFTLGEPEIHTIRDVYFDTADGAIAAAGYAFRYRQVEEKRSIQFKSLAPADGGAHRRTELGVATDQPTRPTCWPESPARDLALGLFTPNTLQPLFTIVQTRHFADLCDGDEILAEFSVDDVCWQAGDAQVTAWELEIELKDGGQEERLSEIQAALSKTWTLSPQPHSKYERGLHLLATAEADA